MTCKCGAGLLSRAQRAQPPGGISAGAEAPPHWKFAGAEQWGGRPCLHREVADLAQRLGVSPTTPAHGRLRNRARAISTKAGSTDITTIATITSLKFRWTISLLPNFHPPSRNKRIQTTPPVTL